MDDIGNIILALAMDSQGRRSNPEEFDQVCVLEDLVLRLALLGVALGGDATLFGVTAPCPVSVNMENVRGLFADPSFEYPII